MQQGFGAAKCLRLLLVVLAALAQERHSAIAQADTAHCDLKHLGLALGVERPDLREAHIAGAEVLLILPQPLFHSRRHVGAKVTGLQFLKGDRVGDFERLAIGPKIPLVIEIEDPDSGVETIIKIKKYGLVDLAFGYVDRGSAFNFTFIYQ